MGNGGQRQNLIDIALDRCHRSEPCLRGKGDRLAEEVDGARIVLSDAVEKGANKFLCRVDPGPLTVAGGHLDSRARVPGSSGLAPRRACLPARSPARRAADEYPAVALLARQVPRALDAVR